MNRRLFVILGAFSLLVSIGAWALDLTGLVEECVYCRTERTIIGVLGFLMLLSTIHYLIKYLFTYLGYVFGYYGAHVASAQIFMNMRHDHFAMMFILATAALFWIIFQVCIIHWFHFHYNKLHADSIKSIKSMTRV